MAETVGFLVIGGQKCATTTLFRHLAQHPDVYMPPQKELNFFVDAEAYARGADWYHAHYFGDAPPGALLGEASPLYLCDGSVAQRIHDTLPDARLLALLRDPIERAYSHYRMAVRRGLESESFAARIREQATRGKHGVDTLDPQRDYLALGEYGCSLAAYLRCFDRRQIRVEFTEDLARQPEQVMRRISDFIGVDAGFRYPALGRVYHAGGTPRFPRPVVRGVRRALKGLRPLVGASRARAAAFWFETQGGVRAEADAGPAAEDRAFLLDYYRKDVEQLSRELDLRPPWPAFA